jgi:hypothetical protein
MLFFICACLVIFFDFLQSDCLFIYLFIYLALPTRAGSPQQDMPITVGPFVSNPPCQLSLWEETGVPGGNPRLSAER